MKNKLQEIKEVLKSKFELTDFSGDIGGFAIVFKDDGRSKNETDLDTLCNDLCKLCVEYARSKVPLDGENPYYCSDILYQDLYKVFTIISDSVQQDIQSLNQ